MIDTWKAWVMLAFGVLIGAVLIYVWPWPLQFTATKKDWVDVLTAFGTLGAVLVAVSLAIWQHSKDRDRGRNLGIIAAATIRQRTAAMRTAARNLGDIFHHVAEEGPFEDVEIQAGEMLKSMEECLPLTPEEILQIIGVSKTCALTLATGNGSFIDAVARSQKSFGLFERGNEALQRSVAKACLPNLTRAYTALDAALDEMDRAVKSFKVPDRPPLL